MAEPGEWQEQSAPEDVFQVPQAHPEIARRLSLSLPESPTRLRAGERYSLPGVLANVGDKTLDVVHDGCAAGLFWDVATTTMAGGDSGWSTLLPHYAKLKPGQRLDLRVHVITRIPHPFGREDRPPGPLQLGVYALQAYCQLTVTVRERVPVPDRTLDGWVVSPPYSIAIG